MMNIFHKFEWDETNFKSENLRFRTFLETARRESMDVTSLKPFPPCILNKNDDLKTVNGYIKADGRSVMITNNLFFGEDFSRINKRFSESPFVSRICRKCKFHKESLCRGLMNGDFVNDKKAIIQRIGLERYTAVKGDYENGSFTAGTYCSKRCHFCCERYIPNEILKSVPFLKPDEVFHFLQYIPWPIYDICSSNHCRMGELAESPYLDEILSLAIDFSDDLYWATNGRKIEEKVLSKFRNKDITIAVTGITLSKKWTKYFVESEETLDLIAFISMLRKNRVHYSVGLIAFKSLIDSGDIFDTINSLLANDPDCHIRINFPSSCGYFPDKMKNECLVDYGRLKSDMVRRYPQKRVQFLDDYIVSDDALIYLNEGRWKESMMSLKEQLEKICSDKKKHLLLCPERTYGVYRELANENVKVACVTSTLGYTNPVAGVLRIKDYLEAMDEEMTGFEDIILPRSSFDINFDDFSLINVNDFWKEVRKRTKALIFM